MSQTYKGFIARRAIAVGALCVYLAVACGVNLFHTEDNPLTTGKTAPSSDSCPACKFLAGANATQALHDSSPAAIVRQITATPAPDSFVVVAKHCIGSIIVLRGPPLNSLS